MTLPMAAIWPQPPAANSRRCSPSALPGVGDTGPQALPPLPSFLPLPPFLPFLPVPPLLPFLPYLPAA